MSKVHLIIFQLHFPFHQLHYLLLYNISERLSLQSFLFFFTSVLKIQRRIHHLCCHYLTPSVGFTLLTFQLFIPFSITYDFETKFSCVSILVTKITVFISIPLPIFLFILISPIIVTATVSILLC